MSFRFFLIAIVLLLATVASLLAKSPFQPLCLDLERRAEKAAQAGCFQEAYHLLRHRLILEQEQLSTLKSETQQKEYASTSPLYATAILGLFSVVLLFSQKRKTKQLVSPDPSPLDQSKGDLHQSTGESAVILDQAEKAILEHLEDDDFRVAALSTVLHVSRSQLHRKIKAACDYSPSVFMRKVRLKEAKRLLEARAGNISEVAIMVGMSNLAYFSRSFKMEFGYPPSRLLQPEQSL